MNWKLGLFRLWLVASIIWVGAIVLTEKPWEKYVEIKWDDGAITSELPPLPPGAVTKYPCIVEHDPFANPAPKENPCMPYSYWPQIRKTATDAFFPPLAVLVLAYAGLWILSGFKKRVSE